MLPSNAPSVSILEATTILPSAARRPIGRAATSRATTEPSRNPRNLGGDDFIWVRLVLGAGGLPPFQPSPLALSLDGSGESRSATCTSFVRPRSVPGAVISRKSAMRIRQFLDRDYRNKSALEPAGWLAGPDQQRCGN